MGWTKRTKKTRLFKPLYNFRDFLWGLKTLVLLVFLVPWFYFGLTKGYYPFKTPISSGIDLF